MICPDARRRSTGSGSAGDHRVRVTSVSTIAPTSSSSTTTGRGLRVSRSRSADPCSTAPQKKPVALGPKVEPNGTDALSDRQLSSDQRIGSVHRSFMFGPVGPL